MATKVIGVDVGTSAVRAVELELSDPPVVRRIGQVALSVGAMQDGEVIDVAAVSAALRRLWDAVGFSSKSVRVGLASARMIVRIIEMPRLSDDELRSAIRLQLEDYVPLAADETVFDTQPLDPVNPRPAKGSKRPEGGAEPPQQLLLAAAHRNAVLPLIEAVRGAGLKLDAVDVVPAALARTFARSDPQQDPGVDELHDGADAGVDLIVSIGAGTVVVVAARRGTPVFVRTLTNISGRRVTEHIAARLALSDVEAERRKRSNVIDVDVDDIAELAAAREAADAGVAELVEEVRDSIAYYAGQNGARPIRRLVLTGGGAQLSGLAGVMADHLELPVEQLDPFAGMKFGQIGFEPEDLPFLAPYAGAALGLALAGRSTKSDRLDLTPTTKQESSGRRTPMLAVGGAVLVAAAFGGLYVHRSSAIGEERATVEALTAQMIEVQTQINALRTAGGPGASTEQATPQAVVESVAVRDVDWVAARQELDAIGIPLGVVMSALQGVAEPFEKPAVTGDPGAAAAVPASVDPNAAATVGRYSVTATAADLNAVAAWLDAVTATPRFAQAWVNGTTTAQLVGGTTVVQFTAEVLLTDANLVRRPYAPVQDGHEVSS